MPYLQTEVRVYLDDIISMNREDFLDHISILATTGYCSNGEGSDLLEDISYSVLAGEDDMVVLEVSGNTDAHHEIYGSSECTHEFDKESASYA